LWSGPISTQRTAASWAAIFCITLVATFPVDVIAKAPSRCAPTAGAQTDALGAITGLISALRADDEPGFKSHVTDSFYAYDGGKRFEGVALLNLIKSLHGSGKKFEWNVTAPEVHVVCDWAWVTYVNKGSVTDASGRQDLSWLESAILRYDEGHWRVQFLHSTRAAAQ